MSRSLPVVKTMVLCYCELFLTGCGRFGCRFSKGEVEGFYGALVTCHSLV